MNLVENPIALMDQPIPAIGKATDAEKLGVFELTLGEVQQLNQLLERARKRYQDKTVDEGFLAFCLALEELWELIITYQTQYVEVWVMKAKSSNCHGQRFCRICKPAKFAS